MSQSLPITRDRDIWRRRTYWYALPRMYLGASEFDFFFPQNFLLRGLSADFPKFLDLVKIRPQPKVKTKTIKLLV
jgi:hypothetical protein